jgi:hypothetical protein
MVSGKAARMAATAVAVAAVFAGSAGVAQGAIPPTGVGSATVVPIQVTGPPANRFDLVVLGDGYTAADMPKFRAQVDKHLNTLWSIEPYKTYRDYINVYAIEIISGVSGVSGDPDLSVRKTTPLSLCFFNGCQVGGIERGLIGNNSAINMYAALAPRVSQTLSIANSDKYGGIGGGNATASGGNSLSSLISPHELGHSIGGLQDEYPYYNRGVLGGCYTGGEPSSVHHTLYTDAQMLSGQKKWWRWLGEPSEAGGIIDRYEGGMYFDKCIWRPSAHSIMRTLGYQYDQVSREVMTQKISSKVKLVDSSTPTTAQVGNTDELWVETQHPVDHELDVTWAVDGTTVANTSNSRNFSLADQHLAAGATHTVTATVVDPTTFVRDPAIRSSSALTQKLTWTVKDAANTPVTATPAFTNSSPTTRPLGRNDVVYAETAHPSDHALTVAWALDGTAIANPSNARNLHLADLHLASGTHTLTATVTDPAGLPTNNQTLTWTVDATDPATTATTSTPTATVSQPGADVPEYVFKGPFTLKLASTDDQTGYVEPEFRVDGDGWQNYYGWPTDSNEPFHFSVTGTDIDLLNYGQLNYGTHVIEYRAIDAAGNVATAKKMIVTYLDPSASDVGSAGGTVPATLTLTLGTPASFGGFTPGLRKDYTATMAANVITTAGNAQLSVADPSATATGHLVNGAFSLPSVLQAQASSPAGVGSGYAPVGGSAAPTPLLTYSLPSSNDPVTVGFQQHIGATDALRTGSYSKTLTFTLSTTSP